MTEVNVPAIEIIKDTIEKIDHHIKIEQVQYIFDTMEYALLLSRDNKNCKVSLSRNLLDDLNDYTGSRQSKYWMGLENNLKNRLSIAMQISSLIPFSSDIFFEDVHEWEQDDGHSIEVYFTEADYEIFQDGLKELFHYLEIQRDELLHLKLSTFPYAEDQQRIQEMILFRNEQITKNGPCPFRDRISVTSRKHLKAAVLIQLVFLEEEITINKYSETVKKEIAAKINKMLTLLSSPVFERIEVAEYIWGIKKDKESGMSKIATPDNQQKRKYDVVISFAGEDRDHAGRLAELLKRDGFKVFYDDYEEADLWGKNLYEHLTEVYSKFGKYCVMFLSKHYAAKQWPTLERRAAQERAFRENREYILPIRMDNTSIPGILDTVGYQDIRRKTIEDIYLALKKKLSSSKAPLPRETETDESIEQLGLSGDAIILLKLLSGKSERALSNDPMMKAHEVMGSLQLSEEDLSLAADELNEKGFVTLQKTLGMGKVGFYYIGTKERLFSVTDKYLKGWNPEEDSVTLAQTLIDIARDGHSASIQNADELLKWGPRRINPALFLLIDEDMVTPSKSVNPLYISMHVILKPKLYRYGKQAGK